MGTSRVIFFTTPLVMLLSACSATTTSQPLEAIEKVAPPPIERTAFSNVLDGHFRGQLSYEDGQAVFESCHSEKKLAIKDNSTLQSIYKKLTINQDESVYIEFTGEIVFPSKNDREHDAEMRVDHIQHMALTKVSLQCAKSVDSFNFKAEGTDPYWRIDMQDNKVYFATKASNQSYTLENSNFRSVQTNYLKNENNSEKHLLLTIEPGHCYMMDNKKYWGYTTKASNEYGVFTGCGEPGRLKDEQQFAGYYFNQAEDINLTINSNNTIVYKQGSGDQQITKTGYWKSNTPGHLVIMMTQQDKKIIREEIISKLDGVTLSVDEINKNNIVEAFDTPLVFNKMNAEHGDINEKPEQTPREFTAQNINPNNTIDNEVQAAVKSYFKIHRTDPKNTQFNSIRFDLNNDGIDEAIVLLDWCSSAGCEMLVFEGQETGLRFSSRISRLQAPLTISKSQHFGWQSLLIKNGNDLLQLNFDGLSYPLNTSDVNEAGNITDSTDVILFSEGRPTQWFEIK